MQVKVATQQLLQGFSQSGKESVCPHNPASSGIQSTSGEMHLTEHSPWSLRKVYFSLKAAWCARRAPGAPTFPHGMQHELAVSSLGLLA